MTRAEIIERIGEIQDTVAVVNEAVAFREAKASAQHRDSAAIVALKDGRFAFLRDQPETHGYGIYLGARTDSETAARRSGFAARLNLDAGLANPSAMRR